MLWLIVSSALRSPLIDTSICSPCDGGAEQIAGGPAVQQHLEDVLAVGREDVDDRDAAARADRRAGHVAHLRAVARQLVDGRAGRRVAIADREAADRARRAQVAFHHRRRQPLLFGDVVEAVRDRVRRQIGVDVDVEAEQLANRVGVLGAIEALRRTRAGIGIARGGAIDARFERFGKRRSAAGRPGASRPAGGIMPARSLRIIFSATRRVAQQRCAASNDASDSSPALPRSLWQPTQYCLTSAVSSRGACA